jgi:hypothetical protein
MKDIHAPAAITVGVHAGMVAAEQQLARGHQGLQLRGGREQASLDQVADDELVGAVDAVDEQGVADPSAAAVRHGVQDGAVAIAEVHIRRLHGPSSPRPSTASAPEVRYGISVAQHTWSGHRR